MKRLAIIFGAVGLFAIATPSLAQTAPADRPLPTQSAPRHRDLAGDAPGLTGARNMGDYAIDEANRRQNLSARARAAVQNTSPGRMSRAERVAELINQGDCTGAYALAREERDRRLASRVAEICEIQL